MFSKTDIETYFSGEKEESLFFIGIGIASIVVASIFYFYIKRKFVRGMAIPLFILGLVQVTVGATVYQRSDADMQRIARAYELASPDLANKELPRMEKVHHDLVLYRWIEVTLVFAAVIMIFLFRPDPARAFLYGFGVGLLLQALILLAADQVAESRAKIYTKGLREFTSRPARL